MAAFDLSTYGRIAGVHRGTVAKIGSAAIAKAIRRRQQKFIAVSCHYDVIEWLQPDWTFDPSSGEFAWRSLQRRPIIEIEVARVHRKAWRVFEHHHYLSSELHPGSKCFCAFVEGQPAAFTAVLPFPHATRPGWREHRTVCLPDFQGVGIGNALSEFVAALFRARRRPYFSSTGNPAMIHHRARSPLWRMTSAPSRKKHHGGLKWKAGSYNRLSAGFEYVGHARPEDARKLQVL